MPRGSVVGVDESQVSTEIFQKQRILLEKAGIALVPIGVNLVDLIWGAEKPSMPVEKLWRLEE